MPDEKKASATDLRKIYRWFFCIRRILEGEKVRLVLKANADKSHESLNDYLKANVPGLSKSFILSKGQYKGLKKALNDLAFDPLNPYPAQHDCW